MESSGNAKFESFNDYPWLDYKKHQNTWLPVMGAGSNGQDKFCILTKIDDNIQRAIITQEIYEMIIAHEGLPIEIRYTFEADGQVYVEIKEMSQGG
jgi:hypothetical protein